MQKTSLMIDTAMESIKNKIIIVAGAAGGIGAATAHRLAVQGAGLVIAGRENPSMTALLEELRTEGADCTMCCGDLTRYDSWSRLLEFVYRRYGRLDALIHCIGILRPESFLELEAADITLQIETNLSSVVYGVRATLPLMRSQHHGHIVVIGSLGGIVPMRHSPLYSATKFAVRGFCFSLFEELKSTGITVSLLSPGPVQTRMLDLEARNDDSAVSFINKPVKPERIAAAVVKVLVHPRREVIMPRVTGILSLLCNLAPGLFPLAFSLLQSVGNARLSRYRTCPIVAPSISSVENSHVELI